MNSDHDLDVTFLNRRAALVSCKADGRSLSLFAPMAHPYAIGTPLRLHIRFGDSDERFILRGKVSFRRAVAVGLSQQPGATVSFEGDDKRTAARMVAYCAGRPLELGTASSERMPRRIPYRVRLGRQAVRGFVHDLSLTGAFLEGRPLIKCKSGTSLTVELDPSWLPFRTQRVIAVVVWTGEKNGAPGCGLRFTEDPAQVRPRLKKYLSESGKKA